MNSADTYLPSLLEKYKKLEKEQQKELKKLPPGQLSVRTVNGKVNYVQILPADSEGKNIRRGITRNQPLIQALARKKYLQKSLKLLKKDIPALEKLVSLHKAPVPTNIIELLPRAYSHLPPETFLPERRESSQWANAEFEQSTYRIDERTHMTASGLAVRSKSEVIIAEKLEAYNIPFRYEQMLYIENQSFSPDFTILRGEELIYWEHCGLVSDPAYMKHHAWKLTMYEKAGIVPWKNLIVTYDDEKGNFNSRIIDAEITGKLL